MHDFDELMREEEARLEAEADTPERIAADRANIRRGIVRSKLEVRRLRRCGGLDTGNEEEE
jgi:hypothetical protein